MFFLLSKKIRAKFSKDGNVENGLKVEIIAFKGPMVVISTGATIFQVNASMLQRPLDTVDLEELRESRERTGPPVLWLSCEGQTDVWELISDHSILSAHDRQGLRVAAPVDLRRKLKASHHRHCKALGQRSKRRIPRSL